MSSNSSLAIVTGLLVLGLGGTASGQEPARQEPQAPAGMAGKCQAMMAQHQKMMADRKTADERLATLVSRVDAASGEAKVDALAAVVTELVEQRRRMHEQMMTMSQETMRHTAEHMQAGAQSMAMCPMMKMKQAKPDDPR